MKYREPKQKPVKAVKNQQPANVQEYSTSKVYKLGEIPVKKPQTTKNPTKKFDWSKLKLDKIKAPKAIGAKTGLAHKKAASVYKKSSKKQKIVALTVVILVLFVAGFMLLRGNNNGSNKSPEVAGKSNIKISFTPIVAPGKTLVVDPEGKRDTGSYSDIIGGINIRVSEQALPADFKSDTETKIASFAKTNYYNEQLSAGDTKVYTGMSIKGVQSVVFVKNNLLIFIKAEQKVDNNVLADYIKSLR